MAKPPRSPSGPRPPQRPRRDGGDTPRRNGGDTPGGGGTSRNDRPDRAAAPDAPRRTLRPRAAGNAEAPREAKPAKLRFGDKSRAAAQARKDGLAASRADGPRAAAPGKRAAPRDAAAPRGDRPGRDAIQGDHRGRARGPRADIRADTRPLARGDARPLARGDAPARGEGARAPYRTARDDSRANPRAAAGADARPASRREPDRGPPAPRRSDHRDAARQRLGADERAAPASPRGPRSDNRAINANRGRYGRPADSGFGDRRGARPGETRPADARHAEPPKGIAAPKPAAVHVDGAAERIAKRLARAGVASRRDVERLIAEGRVALDGVVITTPATILTSLRGITVDGVPVDAPEATRLFVFHKPDGLITAARDPAGRPTIYTALRNALPPDAPRVMPVGRLDYATEGLLLLTNDGELKRTLELPSTGVPRTYRARAYGTVSQTQLEDLIEGIEIDGVRYGKIDANLERRTGANQWVEVTLTEGRNREVRRVLEHLGLEVGRLIRTAYGPFLLGDLPRGAAYEIPADAVERFARTLRPREPRAAAEPKP